MRAQGVREHRNPQAARLQQRLREDILTGALPPGTQLPPVSQLMQQYEISSRGTVQALLRGLAEEGLVVQRRGQGPHGGTRVRDQRRVRRDLDADLRREHDLALAGGTPGHGLYEATTGLPEDQVQVQVQYRWQPAAATPTAAQRLGAAGPELLLVRVFTYLVENTPYMRATSYMWQELAEQIGLTGPQVETPGMPTLAWLYRAGVYAQRVERVWWARMPTADEVQELGIPRGTPVMEQVSTTYSRDTGAPIVVSISVSPANHNEYTATTWFEYPPEQETQECPEVTA